MRERYFLLPATTTAAIAATYTTITIIAVIRFCPQINGWLHLALPPLLCLSFESIHPRLGPRSSHRGLPLTTLTSYLNMRVAHGGGHN